MDASQIYKGVTDLLVLAVLCRGESYGYDILREIRAAGVDSLSDASVYGTLKRLGDQGLLTSRLVASPSGPARKYYEVTEAGRNHLRNGVTSLEQISAAMDQLLKEGERA